VTLVIPTSSAPAARLWLFTQLSAQITPDPSNPDARLIVVYDEPGPDQPEDIVSVGAVHRTVKAKRLVGGGGPGWLDESYTVEITVDVYRGGDDAQGVYTRAQSLVDAVVAVVRSDPSLGDSVTVAVPLTDQTEVTWDPDHLGRVATSVIQIQCANTI